MFEEEMFEDRARQNLAQAYELLQESRVAAAAALLREAIEVAPGVDSLHYVLAGALARLGDFRAAMQEFDVALCLEPDPMPVWLPALADTMMEVGRVREALPLYQKLKGILPEAPMVHAKEGMALILLGEIERGIAACRQAMELDPNNEAW